MLRFYGASEGSLDRIMREGFRAGALFMHRMDDAFTHGDGPYVLWVEFPAEKQRIDMLIAEDIVPPQRIRRMTHVHDFGSVITSTKLPCKCKREDEVKDAVVTVPQAHR